MLTLWMALLIFGSGFGGLEHKPAEISEKPR